MTKSIYDRAIEQFGDTSQLLQTIEECSELTKAIVKYLNRGGPVGDIIEETVDVELMVRQIKTIFPASEYAWGAIRREKVAYLERLLAEDQATIHVFVTHTDQGAEHGD